jgi:hypothetical protein
MAGVDGGLRVGAGGRACSFASAPWHAVHVPLSVSMSISMSIAWFILDRFIMAP